MYIEPGPQKRCDPRDVAQKGFFLGPQSENAAWVQSLVTEVLGHWFRWRKSVHPEDGRAISEEDLRTPELRAERARFEGALAQALRRFERELPKFSPRYVGHMFSEFSLPALVGHWIALLHNPNNISGEASRVGVAFEDEAIDALRVMLGLPQGARGHFTSGGTVANLEALSRARDLCLRSLAQGAVHRSRGETVGFFEAAHRRWEDSPVDEERHRFDLLARPFAANCALTSAFDAAFQGPVVLVPEHRHYSWKKGVALLGLGEDALWSVPLDADGRMSVPALEALLERARDEDRPVALVVSVVGTTELGAIDPVDEIADCLERWRTERGLHFWHHVDAAYGGFFCALGAGAEAAVGPKAAAALHAIGRADSVTLDPHKLGYVPYASGAFLARSEAAYRGRPFIGPYVQCDTRADRGPYTIEGSRSSAGAVATWLTHRAMPFDESGYGRLLGRTIQIRRSLQEKLRRSGLPIVFARGMDTNVLGFCVARPGDSTSQANARTAQVLDALGPNAGGPFIVSRTRLSCAAQHEQVDALVRGWGGRVDTDGVELVRLCLMNPFFGSKEMKVRFEDLFVETLRELLARPTALS